MILRVFAVISLSLFSVFAFGMFGANDGVDATAPVSLRPADSFLPTAPVCDTSKNQTATVVIRDDVPSPRCIKVSDTGHLRITNDTDQEIRVILGEVVTDLVRPRETSEFFVPFGEYLSPGVHRLTAIPFSGPEIWLVRDRVGVRTSDMSATISTAESHVD